MTVLTRSRYIGSKRAPTLRPPQQFGGCCGRCRYPGAALAFAALRHTDLAAVPDGGSLARRAAPLPGVDVVDEVLVRDGDTFTRYRRRPDEAVAAFAGRLGTDDSDGTGRLADAGTAALKFLLRADLPAPAGAQVYALHPAGLNACEVRLLTAADIEAGLTPATDSTRAAAQAPE